MRQASRGSSYFVSSIHEPESMPADGEDDACGSRRSSVARRLRAALTFLSIGVLATFAIVSSKSANAQAAQGDFFKNKTITFLITGGAGGAYDTFARVLARHLGAHIPGNPSVVPTQMVGAGGLTAMNYIYNVAPKDGTYIAMVDNPIPYMPLLGEPKALYDATKMSWIGSMQSDTALLISWHGAKPTSIEDVIAHGMRVAATGAGSGSYFYARLLNSFIGAKLDIIVGYQSTTDGLLAMERGEVDGYPDLMWSTLHITKPQWLKNGDVRLLLQIAISKDPRIPDTPLVMDFAKTDKDRRALELALAPLTAARPIVAPPGLPPDRLATLRLAFDATLADPSFVKDLDQIHGDTNGAMTGQQLAAFVAKIYTTPPDTVAKVATLLSSGQP
jgi:tripartite-type tricarboxylate transporter receptor subunit TctC